MLYIFSGLPGVGKSALSAALATARQAAWLRIDSIEQALRAAGVPVDAGEGYGVAYAVASDNLKQGRWVVADSVNPIAITRRAWHQVAVTAGRPYCDIEVLCSDSVEHRRRLEARPETVAGLVQPTWAEVTGRHYEPHKLPVVRIDTAGESLAVSLDRLLALLAAVEPDRTY